MTFAAETLATLEVVFSAALALCATQKAQAAVAILIIVVDNTSTVLLFIFPSYKINKFKKTYKITQLQSHPKNATSLTSIP
ncbi:hypothetical protein [Gardnerella sp. Marseille-Q9179]|uniref:hypothetical protein n=1 Tax=Gardnerella sp. Marseille-Q9179 TaxID=3383028 RepID=UPI003AF44BAD